MGEAKRTAVYAGTFDPITNGHKDVAERALKIFDRLVVAVAASTPKNCLFTAGIRAELIREALKGLGNAVEVKIFDGLLVDFVRDMGASTIVRGLRAVADYEYEAQMANINRQLAGDLETVFLVTSLKYSFLSSSIVRQIASNNGNVDNFVPSNVAAKLKEVYQSGENSGAVPK
jgi:pantetheine-phosphate adenylyltransferase